MTKNEWLAERVGFKRHPGLFGVWGYPDHHRESFLPDFPNSLDAQVKWVWPEIKKCNSDNLLISFEQHGEENVCAIEDWDVIEGEFIPIKDAYSGKTLAEASFHACCAALGWADKED